MQHTYKQHIHLSLCLLAMVCSTAAYNTDSIETVTQNNTIAEEFYNLAQTFHHENNQTKELLFYKQALRADPNHFKSLVSAANILLNQKKITKAIGYYYQALAINPSCGQAHCNLGECYIQLNNNSQAIKHFNDALNVNSHYAQAHIQLGIVYEEQSNHTKALTHYQEAITLQPDNADVHLRLGKILKKLDRLDQAATHYRHALTLKPKDLNTLIELGNLHNMLDQCQEALQCYIQALEINPNLYTVMYNFGLTLKKLGHIDEAIAVYKKVIEQKPDYTHANFSLALSYLTLGDFKHGWPAYEWRWSTYNEQPKKFDSPVWDGSNLKNKTILLYAEQGFGDTFQFIRYAKLLKQQGACVIFQTQNALATLLTNCPYIDTIIKRGQPVPASDFHLALMSLPYAFKTTIDTTPADIPYIYPNEKLVQHWCNKLAHDKNIKIGICWQGNAQYTTQALRHAVASKSFHVKYFEPLSTIPGISLYSLQKINSTDDLQNIKFAVHDFGTDFDTSHGRFMDTAAVIKNLDLVLTVDTSIGHLAGALGIPVWVLLPKPADWRWMLKRNDSPWYPSMRLFRQKKCGNWTEVMQEVCTALQQEHAHLQKKNLPQPSKITNQVIEKKQTAISFAPIETHLAIEDIIDQVSREKITADQNNSTLSQHTKNLEVICNKYAQKIPELISLVRLLDKVNTNLAKLDQHIQIHKYALFDPEYAEIAEKIHYAHKLKINIKKKVGALIASNKKI